jgi:hypothetical protein
LLAVSAVAFQAMPMYAAMPGGCIPIEPSSAPRASISNGLISAVVLLPDAKNGYYRGSRFDWSGVVGCLTYRGHNYFGAWFPKYDPTRHDSITGPVEEFRASDGDSAPGYDQAKPGGMFVKPGVGLMRRIDERPFNFAAPYPPGPEYANRRLVCISKEAQAEHESACSRDRTRVEEHWQRGH